MFAVFTFVLAIIVLSTLGKVWVEEKKFKEKLEDSLEVVVKYSAIWIAIGVVFAIAIQLIYGFNINWLQPPVEVKSEEICIIANEEGVFYIKEDDGAYFYKNTSDKIDFVEKLHAKVIEEDSYDSEAKLVTYVRAAKVNFWNYGFTNFLRMEEYVFYIPKGMIK